MATYTQHKQPYGPLHRTTRVVDGIVFEIIRGDIHYGNKRRYDLRRQNIPGRSDCYTHVNESDDSEAMMKSAIYLLLGVKS